MKNNFLKKSTGISFVILLLSLTVISCEKEKEPQYSEKNTNYFYRLSAYNPDSVVEYSSIARISVTEEIQTLSGGEDEKKEKEEPKLLPLKLVYFKVGTQNGKIIIAWKHTDESDVVKYVVEKSIDTSSSWHQVYTQLPTHKLPYEYMVEDNFKIK